MYFDVCSVSVCMVTHVYGAAGELVPCHKQSDNSFVFIVVLL